MKSNFLRLLSASMLALLLSQVACAADVAIISNLGSNLTPDEVKEIFLGDKQFTGSTKLIPVDNAALQEKFLAKFLQMTPSKYNSLWGKKSFRDGLTPPAMKSGDAEVIDYIKRTPGAVGYVASPPAATFPLRRLE